MAAAAGGYVKVSAILTAVPETVRGGLALETLISADPHATLIPPVAA